jgi:ribonuclease Y
LLLARVGLEMTFLANSNLEAAGCVVAGLGLGYWFFQWVAGHRRAALELEAKSLLDNARREAEAIVREARLATNEEALKQREEANQQIAARHKELDELEKRLTQRDALINRQLEGLVQQERSLSEQQQAFRTQQAVVAQEKDDLARQAATWRDNLTKLSHLSEAEARALLLKETEQATLKDAADLVRHILDSARAGAEEQARRIISLAIQRYSGEHAFETTTATVALPNEEIKGRIIGREGRNIRAFEAATGVTVLIDDTPNAVVLSSFDPVRREIAREAMQRLILDGRIHPTRIEEVAARVSQEIDEAIQHAGEEAIFRVGLAPMHPEVVKLLGRLRFRHSFSQNILDHSIEVAQLAGLMAAEIGLNVLLAKRTGLLHDIGKALNHEIEGAHALVGADFLKRWGEPEEVVNGVAAHHEEVPHSSSIGVLVSAADAISASRPGARSETMTTYLKRLEGLEKIGLSISGVEKCYAVQAGRELRVIVQPEQTTDDQAFALARQLARRIEEELQYPGQIRVTVIRETRCVEFAK